MVQATNKPDYLTALLSYFFSLLIGLAAVGVCAWVITTHQLFTIDGLELVFISLTVAAFFAAHTVWAVHSGEIRELFSQLRRKPEAPASDSTAASPPQQKH